MADSGFSGFVAVHLGAGFHSPAVRKETLLGAKLACQLDGNLISQDAVGICSRVISRLEDNPLTNAGIGSNLSLDETVECDASIMSGRRLSFGAVASVQGVRNPIQIAEELVRKQEDSDVNSSLVPPMLLVGEGARNYAKSVGLRTASMKEMVTGRSLDEFRDCLGRVSQAEVARENGRLDTVGAIAVDAQGNVAAGCSSGGILLKQPGRVGHAAIFGAGCWAEETEDCCVAASLSGCGESIIRTQFARTCCQAVLSEGQEEELTLAETIKNCFSHNFLLDSGVLRNYRNSHRLAGVVLVKFCKESKKSEIVWAHNTSSMCVGFSCLRGRAKTVITELDMGSSVAVHGCCI